MIKKSAQTGKIGKQFKKAREARGLSAIEVSTLTFININFLNAIESGDYSIFPARVFAVSYFEKYSVFLGIQPTFFDIYDQKNLQDQKDLATQKNIIQGFTNKLSIASWLVAIAAILFLLIFLLNTLDKSRTLEQDSYNSANALEKKIILPSKVAQEIIGGSLLLIEPLLETRMSNSEESKPSEFLILEGEIKKLSLSFVEDSWLEIYQGTSQLIYQLFEAGEILEISITPPFTMIAGNANGIIGLYDQKKINFTQVANELNVSLIEVENE